MAEISQNQMNSMQFPRSVRCKECGGTGWITWYDENNYEVAKQCKCMEKIIYGRRIEFAQIPPIYADNRLSNFQLSVYEDKKTVQSACMLVKKYLDDFKKNSKKGMGLYIYSNMKGSGKTRLASSIANDLIERYYSVRFATCMEIFDEIRKTYDKSADYTESDVLNCITRCKVLVIDDFGVEFSNDWRNEKLYTIINSRYVNGLPTIYTSNFSVDNLRCDDRIKSRVIEKTLQIHFSEENIRRKLALENMQDIVNG